MSASRLREWRQTNNKTQAWLAEKTGISVSQVSKYEQGVWNPNRPNSLKIERVTIAEGVDGVGVPSESWDEPKPGDTAPAPTADEAA